MPARIQTQSTYGYHNYHGVHVEISEYDFNTTMMPWLDLHIKDSQYHIVPNNVIWFKNYKDRTLFLLRFSDC